MFTELQKCSMFKTGKQKFFESHVPKVDMIIKSSFGLSPT
jgi:hypothetical protein